MISNRRVYTHISARGGWTQQWFARSNKDSRPFICARNAFPPHSRNRKIRLPVGALLLSAMVAPLIAQAQQTQTYSTTLEFESKPQTPYRAGGSRQHSRRWDSSSV